MMGDIVLNRLTKTYGKGEIKAVDEVSFSVEKGERFGLIGPDGAGKTSIFRMLATLLLPDGGTASVSGYDVVGDFRQIRRHIGYMPGKFSLYQDLSVEENLGFFATVFNTSVRQNYDLIKDIYVQLAPFKQRRAGALSGGMKQKLALCCALIHRPKVLFLDEPTTGVDSVSRKEFWEMLKGLKKEGITVLVSTPYMDEASLCERIALMQSGEMLTIDSPDEIIRNFKGDLYAVRAFPMSQLLGVLKKNPLVASCFSFGEYHHITFKDESVDGQSVTMKELLLFNELTDQGYEELEIKRITPTIEDCFIQLMNR
ncbi:ABC transporter ATP-binding protein [Negadavirga shengliensis]|uniref:ABC transporter ATP-binding protein n=1 Tax=Negadavirga shengliensis TaxID=1389218 RepID=A0ABV9T5P4_9BACT